MAQTVEQPVLRLFGLVREALARATWALLNGDPQLGQEVIDGDQEIDDASAEVELEVWSRLEANSQERQSRAKSGRWSESPNSARASPALVKTKGMRMAR